MRIESALNTSREGLTAHGQAISLVGDNIANASTPAFKRGRAEFVDILGEVAGGRNSEVVTGAGDGVYLGRARLNFEGGAIDFTGRGLDVALAGNGFFMVGAPATPLYTRAGNFQVSSEGLLTSSAGQPILGYQGADTETLVPINMLQVNTDAVATTIVEPFGNIDAGLLVTAVPPAGSTFNDINNAASFVASQSIYDSLGERHDMNLCFFKNSPNNWTVQAYLNGADTGAGDGVPVLIGQTNLQFNQNGQIDPANAATSVIQGTATWANGAAQSNLTIDLKSFTQFAGGSRITNASQDGQGPGEIAGYEVDQNGGIFAVLDSGRRAQVGTIGVAVMQNVDGLQRVGSSLFESTPDAGQVVVGIAGRGGFGALQGGALESSNVDIADQFVDMIVYQRGYQANSQVLSAASEIIKGTISLIR